MGAEEALGIRQEGKRGTRQQGDDQIVEDRHNALSVRRLQMAGILVQRHVAHVVALVFNDPVTADEREQVVGRSVLSIQAGDAVDHLQRGGAIFQLPVTLKAKDLAQGGPIAIALQQTAGGQATAFQASVPFVAARGGLEVDWLASGYDRDAEAGV